MAIPFYFHSAMGGAPQLSTAARSVPDVLAACLVNGFNVLAPSSAAASGGVLTLNYASAHGYELLARIELSGASVAEANGVWRVASVPAGNQLTVAIPGLADGSVGGTMSTKVAPAGWTEPFTADSTSRVFRMGGGTQRYFRTSQAASAIAYARGYEDMTDLTTGTGPFPTVAHSANGTRIGMNSTLTTDIWAVVATPTWFYYASLRLGGGTSQGMAFCGDLADPIKPADTYHAFLADENTLSIVRSFTGTGSAVTAQLWQSGQGQTPTALAERRFLFGVPVLETNSAFRGLLPGAAHCLPGVASPSLTSPLTSVVGVSGRLLAIRKSTETNAAIAIALDEDWGA
jgi:hypothetical protein